MLGLLVSWARDRYGEGRSARRGGERTLSDRYMAGSIRRIDTKTDMGKLIRKPADGSPPPAVLLDQGEYFWTHIQEKLHPISQKATMNQVFFPIQSAEFRECLV